MHLISRLQILFARLRLTPLLSKKAILCIIVAVSILPACSKPAEPPLRIGTNNWPGYELLYLARSLKFYDDTPIRLVELNNASDVMHSMRTRNLEAATLTLDESLTLIQDGIDIRIILVMDVSNGADVLLVKPHINTLTDLNGKKVAVEYTAVGAILLDAILEKAGLTVADIDIIRCTTDQHEHCYASNDAVITFEPVKTTLLNKGARQLFDSSQIPGRILDVLVVHHDVIKRNPESLKRLLSGYFQAVEHLQDQPGDAATKMAPRLGITPEELLAAYGGLSIPGLSGNKILLVDNELTKSISDLSRLMLEKKLLINTIKTDNIINDKFIPE
jgi:NitT/TauT family transport system substrate-binding protein